MKIVTTKKRKVLCSVLALFVALGIGVGVYAGDYYKVADDTFATEIVEETGDYILYGDTSAKVGFIFYPGAKVEAESYAPILAQVAKEGVCCVIMKMPMHLAIFDMDAADKAKEAFPDVEAWYIGGHSLGGAMAASYVAERQEEYAGLILLAAYSTVELQDILVLSVYGTQDLVLNAEKYTESAALTAKMEELVLEGGNHAQFGYYGAQDGDGEATMPATEQWELTAERIVEFMNLK